MIPENDFASFGVPIVAYVRRVDTNGTHAYAIHAANGEMIGLESSEYLATLAARDKNLLPVLVQ